MATNLNEYNDFDIIVVYCPLFSPQFPAQPDDISKATLVDCPHCKKPMWFSEYKKAIKKSGEDLEKKIIFSCEDCLPELLQENLPDEIHIYHKE